jgi:beta-N-acetylhexosaminidase
MSVLSIGLPGTALTDADIARLNHPWVGGVTLFKRNLIDAPQTAALIASIRASAAHELVLSVDQEGGRVQRLHAGVSALPPFAQIGTRWAAAPERGGAAARAHATAMALEMRALDFDLSFTPVLDLDRGSRVIGDRAFAPDPDRVGAIGAVYIDALHTAGIAACGKHFPGHGSVLPDTHFERAVDPRTLDELRATDLKPFAQLSAKLDAMMLAHVEYPAVDHRPAGYSRRWIRQILRSELSFSGVILSDDIGMAGAGASMAAIERIWAHLDAGCDHVLVCDPALSAAVLDGLNAAPPDVDVPIAKLRAVSAKPSAESVAFAAAALRAQFHDALLS